MRIDSLESISLDELHEAFCRAFADYVIPMTPDRDKFEQMLIRRGADLKESIAAWDGEEIVGFVVNAIQPEIGLAYNVATAVDPRNRGKRVGSLLMNRAIERFSEKKFNEYRLEAFVQNTPAHALYEGVGFQRRREYAGFTLDFEPPARSTADGLDFREMTTDDYVWAYEHLGYEPAWQNALHSLQRASQHRYGIVVRAAGDRVGAGVLFPGGDVSLLVVHPTQRRRGIGKALLSELMREKNLKSARFINLVPGEGNEGIAWLQSIGGVIEWKQFEYIRRLN